MKPTDHATRYEIARDTNGNKVCRVRVAGSRAFSIQTCGNMPQTHRDGYGPAWTPNEVAAYVREYGTDSQRAALCL